MKKNLFRSLAACLLASAAWQGYAAVADHLVLSEVGMNGSPNDVGEYVEIFNPTSNPIDLTNYWLSDYRSYANISNPALQSTPGSGKLTITTADNIVRFPSGTTLQPGQVAVICGKAGPSTGGVNRDSGFLWGDACVNYFGSGSVANGGLAPFLAQSSSGPSSPAPLIFEVFGDNPDVPNMLSAKADVVDASDSAKNRWNFTNASGTGGEFVALFWWDGTADLIKDVDIVTYGSPSIAGQDFPILKTTSSPLGNNSATYQNDGGTQTNLSVGDWDNINRINIIEEGESSAGGNGITGHDETMEVNHITWQGINGWTNPTLPAIGVTPGATPGTTVLTIFAGNIPPTVDELTRNIQYPSPTDAIVLSAKVSDLDGTVASATFYYDSGSGFTSVPATNSGSGTWTAAIGTFSAGTTINYYVTATDNGSGTVKFPPSAPTVFRSVMVTANPIKPGMLVINEVVYDSVGSDGPSPTNQTPHEFAELYNTTNTPLDLTNIQYADGNLQYFTFPAGTIIPAKGYVILAIRTSGETPAGFIARYGASPNGAQVFGWASLQMNNSPETLYLRHAINDVGFSDAPSFIDRVDYTNSAPWPGLSSNSDGQSMELFNPLLDNNDPVNWGGDINFTAPRATPGAQNSRYTSAFITDITLNPQFPAANQSFTVSAKITPVNPAHTISNVRLYTGTGGGFSPINMTLTSTPGVYSGTVPAQPAGTALQYYISANTSEPFIEVSPKTAPAGYRTVRIGLGGYVEGDIIVNEISYDTFGSDTYEFVELYNRTNSNVDLSYSLFRDREGGVLEIPVGTIIKAKGYAVLSMNEFLRDMYPAMPPAQDVPLVVWDINQIVLGNGATGDGVSLMHPNSYEPIDGGKPEAIVNYLPVAPWPTWPNAPDNGEALSPNQTGRTIELINPDFADWATNGARWAWTLTMVVDNDGLKLAGTPGQQNSVYQSSVGDWTLY